MTVRQRLVAITALFVTVPLVLAAVTFIVWNSSVRAQRADDRLDGALTSATRQLSLRQDALGTDVRAAASLLPSDSGASGSASAAAAEAPQVVEWIVQRGLADSATVTAPGGILVASAGTLPPGAVVVLTQSAVLANDRLLTGRVGLGAPAITAFANSLVCS